MIKQPSAEHQARLRAIAKKLGVDLQIAIDYLRGLIPLRIQYPLEQPISNGVLRAFQRLIEGALKNHTLKTICEAFGLQKIELIEEFKDLIKLKIVPHGCAA